MIAIFILYVLHAVAMLYTCSFCQSKLMYLLYVHKAKQL